MNKSLEVPKDYQTELIQSLKDRWWRLENLYWIQNEKGEKVKFKLNWVQKNFLKNMWYFNVILKARQLGFSTVIVIYILDAILFNGNKAALIIAQGKKEAGDLFTKKVKFAYENLPDAVKKMVVATQDSTSSIKFDNNSSIEIGVSGRSGTFQYLHISEYGKVGAKYPEKAKEIKTGALNTVHAGQQIFVESTAEGMEGEFYELCKRAQEIKELGTELTPLDPKFHFYPWYLNPNYTLEYNVPITPELQNYFKTLGVELTDGQKAWYSKKLESQKDDMKREFPSNPRESFEQSTDGVYFNREMANMRTQGRICNVPHDPSKPVLTYWDIGVSDYTAIMFVQEDGAGFNVIDYYENCLEGLPHYVNHLKEKKYTYSAHHWPHDGINTEWGTGEKRHLTAAKLGLKPIKITERSKDLANDHEAVRNILPQCRIDATKCSKLITHLSSYKKEWNENLGTWRDAPRHDEASHGVSSVRTFAVGYKPPKKKQEEAYGNQPKDDWESW